MIPSRMPFLVRLYCRAANMIAPFAYQRVKNKLSALGTSPTRFRERLGHATAPRPKGKVVWFHAASVGESLSVLRLITHMGEACADWSFLITSGTATSAQIVAKRLPPRTTHQFAPLDSRKAMRRFLDHWQPDAGVFVESELWPQMLIESRKTGVPLALINARISDKSARNWKRFASTARYLMAQFSLIHTQDARTTQHLHDLGLSNAYTGQNLKSVSGPLPFDPQELSKLQSLLNGRPVWVASSTHPGEDTVMITAHQTLLQTFPDLLLVLVPRHPERARDIETLINEAKLNVARRSTDGRITTQVQVYLADTLGETGLWYALSPVTCVGGTFTPVGGHNPFEPAYAGSAILHGPLYANFKQAYADIDASGGAIEVADAHALAQILGTLLDDTGQLQEVRARSRAFSETQDDLLDEMTQTLSKALSLPPSMVDKGLGDARTDRH